MTERNKLRKSLREHYDNQQFGYDQMEWERASAILRKTKRTQKLRILTLTAIVLVSACLFIPARLKLFSTHKMDQQRAVSDPTAANQSAPVTTRTTEHLKNSGEQISERVLRRKKDPAGSIRRSAPHQQPRHPAHAARTESRGEELTKPGQLHAPPHDLLATQMHEAEMIAPSGRNTDNENPENKTKAGSSALVQEPEIKTANETIASSDPEKYNETSDISTPGALPPIPAANPPLADIQATINGNNSTQLVEQAEEPAVSAKNETSVPVIAAPSATAPQLLTEGIFYEAGIAWFYGWHAPGKHEGRGFSPTIGIGYMNHVEKRVAVSFGVQYQRLGNLFSSSKTSRESYYIYGEHSKVTVITPAALHYLFAPIRLHYLASEKQQFGCAINLAYLLNVDASVTTYEERPGFQGPKETIKLSGYTRGFSWLDTQLGIFYNRRLSRALSAQVEMFYGLTDIKNNGFFEKDQFERSSGLKLTLIYYTFRKNIEQ